MREAVGYRENSRRRSTWRKWVWCAVTLALLLGKSTGVAAQGQVLGAIHGVLRDQQGGVLPGVVITLKPTESRPSESVTTDAAGFYTLKELQPGEYEVKAELPSFATLVRSGVIVRAGLTLSLDLVMSVGGVGEVVTVHRDAPLLEASSAATAVNIAGDFQRNLPLSGRNSWSDFLLMVPGAVPQESFNGFFYAVHGSGADSKIILIDGHEVNGADATNAAPDTINLSVEAISDVQVVVGGVSASTPLGESAVLNVVTKSGTDRFAGSVRLEARPEKLNDTNVSGGTSNRVSSSQVGGTVGGPIDRGRAWFFGTYEHLDLSTGIFRSADRVNTLRQLFPSFQPFDNDRTGNYYYFKPSLELGAHHISASYRYDPTDISNATDSFAEPFTTNRNGGQTVGLSAVSIWPSSLSTEVRIGYNNTTANDTSFLHTDLPSRSVFSSVRTSSGALVGTGLLGLLDNVPSGLTSKSDKLTTSFDASYVLPHLKGRHELRGGIFFQRLRFDGRAVYPNGGFSQEDMLVRDPLNYAAGIVPFHRVVFERDWAPRRFVSNDDLAVYFQDSWAIGSRATVTLGARLDRIETRDLPSGIQTQSSTDVGPRFGIVYALTSDKTNILRFSATRRHDAAQSTAPAASTNAIARTDTYDLDLNGTFETSFTTPASTVVSTDRRFDPNLHQPFVDEYDLGYQHQISGGVTLGVNFINQLFKDRPTGVESNRLYDENNRFIGYRDQSLNDVYLVTNNSWNWTVYRALELQAAKQTSTLSLIGSYTHQWRHIAGTWQPNDIASILQPATFANDHGLTDTGSIGLINNLAAAANSYQQGGSFQWRDNILSLSAGWKGPFQIYAAGNYEFATGMWSGPILMTLAAADPRFGPPSLRLTNGRLVQNPLATTLRFANDTRGVGQFKAPALHRLGLSVGRVLRMGRYRIEPTVRAFNLTNHDADQALASQANLLSSSTFGQFTLRQPPRAVAFMCRVAF